MLPPPSASTFTSAALVKLTSALAISSGKLRLLSTLISISPAADNPPNSTFPPGAKIFPPDKLTLPPAKVISFPTDTSKPRPSFAVELLLISPGLSPKPKPIGTSTVSIDSDSGAIALNSPSGNKILLAVLPKNEPPIFKLAFSPKTIPAGLIKNKLALPLALIAPSISDKEPPVTLENILLILSALLKKASLPVGTEKSWKLWNRLLPLVSPPVISVTPPFCSTRVFTVLSGTT